MMYSVFFTYFIKTCALLFLFWALYKMVLTRETFFRHNRKFLLLGAIISVLLPLWIIERTMIIEVSLAALQNTESQPIKEVTPKDLSITPEAVLFFTYLGGILVFSLKLLMQFASLRRVIRKGNSRKSIRGLHLVFSHQVQAPFSFFNYIVLPYALKNKKDASVILAHEAVHVKQMHSLDILLMHLLTIFMWINPIAWIYRREVAQNLEYLADREVSSKTIPPRQYQYVLLKQHLSPNQLSIINPFINSLIKKRIVMLQQKPSKPSSLWKFGIALPILIAFILLVNVKTVAQYQFTTPQSGPQPSEEPESAEVQEKMEFTIRKDMDDNQLRAIQASAAAQGGEFKWKKLKRNQEGIITRIAVVLTYNKSQASANYDNSTGIEDIHLGVKNGSDVYIATGESMESEKEMVWVTAAGDREGNSQKQMIVVTATDSIINGKQQTRYMIKRDGKSAAWTTELSPSQQGKLIHVEETTKDLSGNIEEMEKKIQVHLQGIGSEMHFQEGDTINHKRIFINKLDASQHPDKNHSVKVVSLNGTQPLTVIDGVEAVELTLQEIDPGSIAQVEILKGEKAVSIYGAKGKDGVIQITTKNNAQTISIPAPHAPPGISDIDWEQTAVYIDGKEVSEKEMKDLSPENIKQMEVSKGEEAKKKYGKPNAILITTKNQD